MSLFVIFFVVLLAGSCNGNRDLYLCIDYIELSCMCHYEDGQPWLWSSHGKRGF